MLFNFFKSDLDIIKTSPYFNADYYYEQRPDVKKAGIDAAEHYLHEGWKENANPSARFCTALYLAYNKTKRCPLLDYEHKFWRRDYSTRGSLKINICLFHFIKHFRKAKTCCYTYISKGYDNLLSHRHINYDWDYICFTDDNDLIKHKIIGIWQIKKAIYFAEDSKICSGWHKTHPEDCCKFYHNSVWIDGNVNILSSYLRHIINNQKYGLLVPAHYSRDCIFDECNEVCRIKRDKPKIVKKQLTF